MQVEIIYTDSGLYENGLAYQSPRAAALDLRCAETLTLVAGQTRKVSVGLRVWGGSDIGGPDEGLAIAAMIVPRSGLGSKGLVIGNLVGLIDEDYQGDISVTLWNRSDTMIHIDRGDRVAQMLFTMVFRPTLVVVEQFSQSTARGAGGHGSTGIK